MKRMIRAAASAALLVSGLGSVGCVNTGGPVGGVRDEGHGPIGDCWRRWVDPCWPERYNYAARMSVVAPFGQQVYNGQVLNQTIYNYYFEFGTDTLTPAGIEKLNSLARVRPAPDPKLFIQTARDLPANTDPARIADVRGDLDARRSAAVLRFMATQPNFVPVTYETALIDPVVPGIASIFAEQAYRGSLQGYRGNVSGGGTGVLGTGSGGASLTAPPATGGTGGGFGGPAGATGR